MGTNKGLLTLPESSDSLLEHSQKQLALICGNNIFISGSGHEQGIADIMPNCGPLSGIHGVITHIDRYHTHISELLVVAVDMPDLCFEDFSYLLKKGKENNRLCCFENCFLPLYIPLSVDVTTYLATVFKHQSDEAVIETKQRHYSVNMMLDSLQGLQIKPLKNTQLDNINTPAQWQQRCAGQTFTKA